jgi:preprotein translocase subunit YajC
MTVLNLLISSAHAQNGAAASSPAGSGFSTLILVGGMVLIFYFFLILPQKKQEKKRQEMINALVKGDEVITQSGVFGKVAGVAEKVITLEVAPNVKIKVSRHAIAGLANTTASAA